MMTDEQMQKLLEIEEEVLTESNLKYFPSKERSREFSKGFLSQITEANLIEIFKRYELQKPTLKLYKVDFPPMYPVPSTLIVLAYDKQEAEQIASQTIIHTKPSGIEEITMDKPKVVVYESGDY